MYEKKIKLESAEKKWDIFLLNKKYEHRIFFANEKILIEYFFANKNYSKNIFHK